ncbi:MAG: electron transfer flavoprotein subunit beta/FixA family protein [Gammaproteobacteria bacterium]|nr:electron transfer flavoprotein subunit beta/FixA family protein [Gammaproteobacteria bacterium]MDE2023841.1 electron transfer flavoprotein subunit beta/FixA family protein [Gammaproteobacteria bacterium]MDE2274378.1 electron transfer flavoprotein subunit beta/FixA family protein [Gammaproteobacteria bacterium]
MKILVGIKRVIDFSVRVQVKKDGSGVNTDGVKLSINPFDEIALEEALRIREKGMQAEVVAVSIGPAEVQQQLRTALAMGVDRAVLVETGEVLQPLMVARIFHELTKRENADLVILGKQAIDDDCNQTGQMLAALWDRPQATFASKVELKDKTLTVTREVDAGLETISVDLPAVVTTDLRLNTPRFVKMPDIMKARSKPLQTLKLDDLGVAKAPELEITNYAPPPQRVGGKKVADVPALISALKERGVL